MPIEEGGELPEVLTVEEAADVLRISRNSAYALARQWRESGGTEGLPVIRLGRTLRVPRAALQTVLACSFVPPDAETG
jgi:excisionase family DNA binding protein